MAEVSSVKEESKIETVIENRITKKRKGKKTVEVRW